MNESEKPIYVTKPCLPALDDFIPYLKDIWESRILTNGGKFHQLLEQALCDYLGVQYISLCNNGTNALLTALQALELQGEVITTPFSFIATSNSLIWNNLSPVFVDIEPGSLNLDPQKIEAAISPKTSAIMPVHCYGNPCKVEAIQEIADKYRLKVVYDAAHAFAVRLEKGSLLQYGDLSVLSFHATKVFNTCEGGAIVSASLQMKQKIDQLKNFGIIDELHSNGMPGLNGKMNEMQAALGLAQLKNLPEMLEKRRQINAYYRETLSDIEGLTPLLLENVPVSNYAYFPILIDKPYPLCREKLYHKLKNAKIFARRYFYPLISNLPMYAHFDSSRPDNLPLANQMSEKILCLPIYPDLSLPELDRIVNLLREK